MQDSHRIGVIIVSYDHQDSVKELLKALDGQKRPSDKIVVVDNHPDRQTVSSLADSKKVDLIVESDNRGFAAACNLGVSKIVGDVDLLMLINPDTLPDGNLMEVVRNANYKKYSAVMPLITLPDQRVNSAGNVVHISGLSWCDGYERPSGDYAEPKRVEVLSGACMAMPVPCWEELGGMDESYFMYYEDTDLSTRIALAGGGIGLLPGSHVQHDYDYEKGTHKWLYLERNRPLYIIKTWPLAVIVVLSIQLLFVELGLWVAAAAQGRLASKARAAVMSAGSLPSALRTRRLVQKTRRISSYDFLKSLKYELDTPILGALGSNKLVRLVFSVYYRVSVAALTPFR